MKKVHRKPPEERVVKYLHFKSYHGKGGKPEGKPTDCPKAAKKSHKTTAAPLRVSGYKGDPADQTPEEADGPNAPELELADALKRLQLENASLKQSLHGMVSSASHEQLKIEFEQSECQRSRLQQDVLDLQRNNDTLSTTVVELTDKCETLERERDELEDRLELVCDKVTYLNDANQRNETQSAELLTQVQKLKSDLSSSLSSNDELRHKNTELSVACGELQNAVDKKTRKLEAFQAKWESSKLRLQNTMLDREDLMSKLETDSKFVQLMENDIVDFKQKTAELTDKNNALTKQLVEMKKSTEQLRHKYDGLKKTNKSLKEKERWYFAHDRINVGKYVAQVPPMPDREVKDLCSPGLQISSAGNHPRKSKPEKNINERLYKILHGDHQPQRKSQTKN